MASDIIQLQNFLHSQSVLTLATVDTDGPWAAPVLYVADTQKQQPSLYFLSSSSSRHIKSLSETSGVAASIYAPYLDDWQAIKGLQMQGKICKLANDEGKQFEALYFDRFPEILRIINKSSSEYEEKIATAFKKSSYFVFNPFYIRITDNSDSFGSRKEWYF